MRRMGTVVLVDCAVVVDIRSIVLIRRSKSPHKGMLALPGGHLETSDRTLTDACVRELSEEIGLEVKTADLRLYSILDTPDRDPRYAKAISVVYYVDITTDQWRRLRSGSDAASLELRTISDLSSYEMAFDHGKIINQLCE